MRIRIPWKLKQVLRSLVGEDFLYNRASYRPDFKLENFTALLASNSGQCTQTLDSRVGIVNYFLHGEGRRPLILDERIPFGQQALLFNSKSKLRLTCLAETLTADSYEVYREKLPPLNNEFNWNALKKGVHNDQLYMSRPQRFGFAPVLAQTALYEVKYLPVLFDLLSSWQNYAESSKYRWPYNSSHALVYRVIALILTWQFVSNNDQQTDSEIHTGILYEILNILKSDVAYLAPRIGHAHPNNHLLADYFIGWLIYDTFPDLIPAGYDFSKYEQQWQHQLLRQFYPDGGCFEHAVHYHEHGCEMAIIYRLICNEEMLPREVDLRIKSMFEFQICLNGYYDNPWPLGDVTEDTLLPLDDSFGWSSAVIRAVHNKFYNCSSEKLLSDKFDAKSYWLLGVNHDQREARCRSVDSPGRKIFNDSGIVHYHGKELHSELLFRTGVLTATSFMPGHMHADALSLYWRVKGVDFLGASGTYSYKFSDSNEVNFRRYFCGPQAHSCVTINDEDPLGVLSGNFRDNDNGLRVDQQFLGNRSIVSVCIAKIVSTNCYNGLTRVLVDVPGSFYLVIDLLANKQIDIPAKANWYLGRDINVKISGRLIELSNGNAGAAYLVSSQYLSDSSSIASLPFLTDSWYSPSYGEVEPNKCVSIKYEKGKKVHATALTLKQGIDTCNIITHDKMHEYSVIELCCEEEGGYARHLIYYAFDEQATICVEGIDFDAKTLVRTVKPSGRESMIAFGCRSIVNKKDSQDICSSRRDCISLRKESEDSRWVVF